MHNETYEQLTNQVTHLNTALKSLVESLKYSLSPECEDEFLSCRRQIREKIAAIYEEIHRREVRSDNGNGVLKSKQVA